MSGVEFDDPRELFKLAMREAYTSLSALRDPLWVEADKETRLKYVKLFAENKMVSLGYVPSTWTYKGICKRCGEVPLDGEVDSELIGCPWCAMGAAPKVYTFT